MDTNRKASESEQEAEALQEQREWLRVTLSSLGDAVVTTDIKGCVAQHLRQQPLTKNARLIAMTGYGQDSDRQRSEEAGFDRHLVKPVNPQELQELLATGEKQPRSMT
jgi:CheY-like chemotaxis protein